MLTAIGLSGELFHTAAGTAFADIPVNGHRETWPIRSNRLRSWLRRCHYQATAEAASAAAIRSALDLLEARAQFEGPQRAVHIRIAEDAGYLYLDLADEQWRAVQVGPEGWQVVPSAPVRFRRPPGMLRCPYRRVVHARAPAPGRHWGRHSPHKGVALPVQLIRQSAAASAGDR